MLLLVFSLQLVYVSTFILPLLTSSRGRTQRCIMMNNKPPTNVDKMRLNYQKARAVNAKSSREERKTQASKVPEKEKIRTIPRLLPTQDKPVFELFVRSPGSPW